MAVPSGDASILMVVGLEFCVTAACKCRRTNSYANLTSTTGCRSSFPPWMQQSGDRQPKNYEDLL